MKRTTMNIFADFIAAKGLNMSRQRTLILDAFLSAGPQISVDDLYIKLRTQYPMLGRTTVYRTLKLLVECGIARAIDVDGVPLQYGKDHFAEYESPAHTQQTGAESVTSDEKFE